MQDPSPNNLTTHSRCKVQEALFRELLTARGLKLRADAATLEKTRLPSWELKLVSRDSSQGGSLLDYGTKGLLCYEIDNLHLGRSA
jgi:hypothetical protein